MKTDPGALSDAVMSVCIVSMLLMPLAAGGLAMINAGLNRSRNAAHGMLSSLSACGIAIVVYVVFGCAWQGFSGQPAHIITAGGVSWNWLGSGQLFLRDNTFDGSLASLSLPLRIFGVALAVLIPLASGAERWRLAACCASTAIFAAFTYPLFAHWVWGGGWLAQLGARGIGYGFVDPGGASCIQAAGGLTALCIAWILGPRKGKFTAERVPVAMPGHNAVIVLFGCFLVLVGWLGLNCAGSIVFARATLPQLILAIVNTTISAASGALAALAVTRLRFGKPDASLTANAWVSGLVASSAACSFVKPVEAVLIGLISGALVVFAIDIVEVRMHIDDPGGAISVHAVGGLWGVIALGIFGEFSSTQLAAMAPQAAGDSGQFLAQLIGAATLIGFVLPVSFFLNWLLDRFLRQRVAVEGERQGMDLFELGAGAYPDFVSQREDMWRR